MKAVIMAGGKGTRLRPLTLNTPKPMVPLLNRPCMSYIIELLKQYDIHQIAVTVQYMSDTIRHYYGDGSEYGVQLVYFEEDVPLGTAGSIKNAESFLDESFIVISGDALTDFNLRKAVDYHKQKQAVATMVLAKVDNPVEYGVVMTAEDGLITRFIEKPSWSEVFSDTVNTGIYILEPSILQRIPPQVPYDFSLNVFPDLLKQQQPLYGYAAQGYWSDIGSLDQYRQTQFDMLDRKVNVVIQAAEVMPGLFVEPNVHLPSRVSLNGPSYIGSDCSFHPHSSVGPYTILGQGNIVHSNSSLERTILWEGNLIGAHCELQDALLMDHVSVGNSSHIQAGAVIGSNCEIGTKAVIKPHVKLWSDKSVPAHAVITSSLIWNEPSMKPLFRGKGVTGIPNADIQPERLTKLASAYGSTLPRDAVVLLGSCAHPYAHLLKEAMMLGLRTVGIHVVDLTTVSDEGIRYQVRNQKAAGAVHIRLLPKGSHSSILLEWMDHQGMPLAKSAERKIEQAYIQDDYIRSSPEHTGSYKRELGTEAEYLRALEKHIDYGLIRDANLVYVLLTAPTVNTELIQRWTSLIGGSCMLIQQQSDRTIQLSEHVQRVQADLGIYLDDQGSISLVTSSGEVIHHALLSSIVASSLEQMNTRAVLGIPASHRSFLPQLSKQTNHLRTIITKESLRSIMEATVGLPFSPAAYRLYTVSLILQHLVTQHTTLDRVLSTIPVVYTAREEVNCQWNEKGVIMRRLLEWIRSSGQHVDLLDGIRISAADGSVLILPDQDEPLFTIYAEASSYTQARILAHEYATRLTQTPASQSI